MFRGILPLTLSLCVGAAAAPAALAQTAAPINEDEVRAIAVDAYVYFYPLLSMDITRKQFTNVEPGKDGFKGPMNTFVNVREYPPADFKGVVRSNLYFVFLFLAGHDQGAGRHYGSGYRWTLLPAAHARHVDRRLRLARLANHGHESRDLSDNAPRLEARFA